MSVSEPGRFVFWRWQPKTARQQLIFFGALLVFLSSMFVAFTAPEAYRGRRLSTEGRPATGTVIKKVLHRASDNPNSDSSTSYEVDYTFTTANGRRIAGSEAIDADGWDRLNEGGPIEIEYAASAPRINQIAGEGGYLGSAIIATVFSLVWLVGTGLILKGWLFPPLASAKRSPGQESKSESQEDTADDAPPAETNSLSFRLTASPWIFASVFPLVLGPIFLLVGGFGVHEEHVYRTEGKQATGIVLTKSSHEEHRHDNNSNSDTRVMHYLLGYRFSTEAGQSLRGSEEVSWRAWSSIHERDPIQIVYLPHHPATNRLAGQSSVLVDWLFAILGALLSGAGVASLGYGVLIDAPRRAARLRDAKLLKARPSAVAREALPRRHT
jgi:hypothetical protein